MEKLKNKKEFTQLQVKFWTDTMSQKNINQRSS